MNSTAFIMRGLIAGLIFGLALEIRNYFDLLFVRMLIVGIGGAFAAVVLVWPHLRRR